MKTSVRSRDAAERLIWRGRALGLLAELIAGGGDTGRKTEELQSLLDRLGLPSADGDLITNAGGVLDRGGVPAYETSYEEARTARGGMTFQMADVAGFYQAFGFEVQGERPDHLLPELEFVALTLAKEAYALLSGDQDAAEVCVAAREKFMAQHLGIWLPLMASRADSEGHAGLGAALRLLDRVLVA